MVLLAHKVLLLIVVELAKLRFIDICIQRSRSSSPPGYRHQNRPSLRCLQPKSTAMWLEKEPKRLHNDVVPESEEPAGEPVVEGPAPDDSRIHGLGDPRLIDFVPWIESRALGTVSEEFCVPKKSGAQPKASRRSRDEEEIQRGDLKLFCETILEQDERRGYWEISPEAWSDHIAPVFEFQSLAFLVQAEEKKLIRSVHALSRNLFANGGERTLLTGLYTSGSHQRTSRRWSGRVWT